MSINLRRVKYVVALNGILLNSIDGTDYEEMKRGSVSLQLMPGNRSVVQGEVTIVNISLGRAEENYTFRLCIKTTQERVSGIPRRDKDVVHVTMTDDEEDEDGEDDGSGGAREWHFEAIILTTFSQTRCSLLIK